MARFMRKGITKVWFVTTLTPASATATLVNAGTNLSATINEMTGFTFSNNPIMTPDMGSAFVSQIPGEDASSDSSIKIYEDDTANAILTTMAKGTDGYVVIASAGTAGATAAADDVVDIWPVTVSSSAKQYTVGNEAAILEFKFAITLPPTVEKTLVA